MTNWPEMSLETVVSGASLTCSAALIVAALVGATGLIPQMQLQADAVLAALGLGALSGAEAFTAWKEKK